MRSVILVHPDFDACWPFAADHLHALWRAEGPVELRRVAVDDRRAASAVVERPGTVMRLALLAVTLREDCIAAFAALREVGFGWGVDAPVAQRLEAAHVAVHRHSSEGFWGQSVAEFALALTLCGLRRIPQLHARIVDDQSPWDYSPPGGVGAPGARGGQYGDDPRFTAGTIAGKRVRVVGAGNIASRYASWLAMMGADVACWDPYAAEPCFHRAGARRERHLECLVRDAEIFAPMLPLTDKTRGMIGGALVDALPRGCLVVQVTRAEILDTAAVRRRVLADELALAADVFDVEPLPVGDPLLGRHNVVHTPHNAGRTRESNQAWAEDLAARFTPSAPAAIAPARAISAAS